MPSGCRQTVAVAVRLGDVADVGQARRSRLSESSSLERQMIDPIDEPRARVLAQLSTPSGSMTGLRAASASIGSRHPACGRRLRLPSEFIQLVGCSFVVADMR